MCKYLLAEFYVYKYLLARSMLYARCAVLETSGTRVVPHPRARVKRRNRRGRTDEIIIEHSNPLQYAL